MSEFDDLPLFATWGQTKSKLELAFWEFHKNNPDVYFTLVSLARQWRGAGRAYLGIAMLFERARWDLALQTTGYDFKLNNNHRAFYARLIMEENSDLKDLFSLRQQRIQATVGADNSILPSGEHVST